MGLPKDTAVTAIPSGAKSGRVLHAQKLRVLELHEETGALTEAAPDGVVYHLDTIRATVLQCGRAGVQF